MGKIPEKLTLFTPNEIEDPYLILAECSKLEKLGTDVNVLPSEDLILWIRDQDIALYGPNQINHYLASLLK